MAGVFAYSRIWMTSWLTGSGLLMVSVSGSSFLSGFYWNCKGMISGIWVRKS